MMARLQAVLAYLGALRVHRMSRPAFERWQARQVAGWLARDLRQVDFYAGFAPGFDAASGLSALPVIDKAQVMARFEDFNRGRITAPQGWQALAGSGQIGDVSLGASTGTSGNRMLYAVTPAERFRWLGIMLAKAIPLFFLRKERVAVILPQGSALYDGANTALRMRLQFFDLRLGPETWADALVAFAPTLIIAPPRVLRHLTEAGLSLAPRRIFAAAETLDPVDRRVIEAGFAQPLGQIYMATEGLFGVSCRHGRLHLAEDAALFEFEPVGEGLVSPLVTGFRRSFQIMARYRMNDLLRLSDAPCPCGSPLRVVQEVVGRMDDAFAFGAVLITPDVLRNAVLDAAREIDDFRLCRDGPLHVTLTLKPDLPPQIAEAARQAVLAILVRRGLAVTVDLCRAPLALDPGRKLRRVENIWQGDA